MKIIETIALITINHTLFVQLASFLLLLFLLNRIMFRPLRQIMSEREALLNGMADDISSAEQSYTDIGHQIESQENAARREASRLRDDIEASGQQSAAAVIDQARQQINALKAKAKEETAAKVLAARQEIEREAAAISDQMIASVLGRRSAT
jgi:F-type H+-transporting ATPase subunit b